MALTERQLREIEYHKDHAAAQSISPVNFDVITSASGRWWNAYWYTWTYLKNLGLRNKRVLVVGCGAGDDAIVFAKAGAKVYAFDLSPDMLTLARARADMSDLQIDFREMPSERLTYPDASFDLIFARDILHHVEIPETMKEIARVSAAGAIFVADEVYSHTITYRIRYAKWVEKMIVPFVRKIIYNGQVPYITADERKMTERDIAQVKNHLSNIERETYFDFIVTRFISGSNTLASKLDQIILRSFGRGIGKFMGGRVVLIGRVQRQSPIL